MATTILVAVRERECGLDGRGIVVGGCEGPARLWIWRV